MFRSYGPGRWPGLEALKEQGEGRRPARGARRRVARKVTEGILNAQLCDLLDEGAR